MNWNCENCHNESFKYKLVDLEGLTKNKNVNFADFPKIFSKNDNESLLCGNCVNIHQHLPLTEAQIKLQNFLQTTAENTSVIEINGILMVVPDSKKNDIAMFKHLKETMTPQVMINPQSENPLTVPSSSESPDHTYSLHFSSPTLKEESMETVEDNSFEPSTSHRTVRTFAAAKTGGSFNIKSRIIQKDTSTPKKKRNLYFRDIVSKFATLCRTADNMYECLICKNGETSEIFHCRAQCCLHAKTHDKKLIEPYVVKQSE